MTANPVLCAINSLNITDKHHPDLVPISVGAIFDLETLVMQRSEFFSIGPRRGRHLLADRDKNLRQPKFDRQPIILIEGKAVIRCVVGQQKSELYLSIFYNQMGSGAGKISHSRTLPNSLKRLRLAVWQRWRLWRVICAHLAFTQPARSLSFDGVEYELVEHALTHEQTRIYEAYARAFAIIHNNLDAAMEAANITGAFGTLNRQAKYAAHSAFESAKQRFFGHLLNSMKTPTLIQSITADLEAGHAAVIQIVSTGEALMERRLAELPTDE